MITARDIHEVYNRLYAMVRPTHPLQGVVAEYGRMNGRVGRHSRLLRKFCPPPASVLEVGCGRGFLVSKLEEDGYKVIGTEVATSLFDGPLKNRANCLKSGVEHLKELFERGNQFDAVVCNDVLEHLLNEDAVCEALNNIHFVTKRWVVLSMGNGRSGMFTECLGNEDLPIDDLHTVREDAAWWCDTVGEWFDIKFRKKIGPSTFIVGKKKA